LWDEAVRQVSGENVVFFYSILQLFNTPLHSKRSVGVYFRLSNLDFFHF